jgi:glutathione S-transferase
MIELVGVLDSPYVRRVAISLSLMNIPFKRRPLSVFRDFPDFKALSPTVKAPSLLTPDGGVLVDSSLILDYAEECCGPDFHLLPKSPLARAQNLSVIGTGLVVMEKSVQNFYERHVRPPDKYHAPWIERVQDQLRAALSLLEAQAKAAPSQALSFFPAASTAEIAAVQAHKMHPTLTQADITAACAWRFCVKYLPDVFSETDGTYPALADFCQRLEALPVFQAYPPLFQ